MPQLPLNKSFYNVKLTDFILKISGMFRALRKIFMTAIIEEVSSYHSNNQFDDKIELVKFFNASHIYDGCGEQTSRIIHKQTNWQKFIRLFISRKKLPYPFIITNMRGTITANISYTYSFNHLAAIIADKKNRLLYKILLKRKDGKHGFVVTNASGMYIARLFGDSVNSCFTIKDVYDNIVGTVHRKDTYNRFTATRHLKCFNQKALLASIIASSLYLDILDE